MKQHTSPRRQLGSRRTWDRTSAHCSSRPLSGSQRSFTDHHQKKRRGARPPRHHHRIHNAHSKRYPAERSGRLHPLKGKNFLRFERKKQLEYLCKIQFANRKNNCCNMSLPREKPECLFFERSFRVPHLLRANFIQDAKHRAPLYLHSR